MKNLMVVMLGLLVLSPSVAFATNPAPSTAAAAAANAQANPTVIANPTQVVAPTIAPVIVNAPVNAPVGVGEVKTKVKQDVKVKTDVRQSTRVSNKQKQQIRESGNSDVRVEGDDNDVNVPASAPALGGMSLTAAPETCMGSFNLQGTASTGLISFGIGGGKTYVDKDCTRRMNARMLAVLGRADVALQLLQNDAEVKQAFADLNAKKAEIEGDEPTVKPVATPLAGEIVVPQTQVLSVTTSTNFGTRSDVQGN